MDKIPWQPTNEPGRYDEARIATLKPVQQAIERLRLPVIRLRKLMGICNALQMQIEDGGDAPVVNDRLLESLRLMAIHQVGEEQASDVLQAIDNFARMEEARWEQARAGTLPPPELEPDEELNGLMQAGYALISANQATKGCNQWLAAWEQVKKLATPAMRDVDAFDDAYPGLLQSVFNWSQDLEMELHNVGLNESVYFEHRIHYAREYLAQFPEDSADRHINFRRAEGEALWLLGRIKKAESVYQRLIETYPDHAWGYIGWSDQYYMWGKDNTPRDYKLAEKILRQALARPALDDRGSVEDRLAGLFEQRKQARQKSKTTIKQSPQKRKFRRGRKRGKK